MYKATIICVGMGETEIKAQKDLINLLNDTARNKEWDELEIEIEPIDHKTESEQEKTLAILARVWSKFGVLRLCQLLSNCFEFNDLYYVTNKQLRIKLEEFLLNQKGD
ncbi:hypothetical protein LCGC14_0475470 [marine sediment metagenome]|uniref:Uncharacterized protein n=1 Tax=marine sediment metagenome TaxID=412755 RepID=A0A0F9SG84_9ZZZZ